MTPAPLQKLGSKNLPNANKGHVQTLNTHHSETRGRATHATRSLCAAHRCVRYLHAPTPDPNPGNSRRTRGWNCDGTSAEAAGTLGPCGAGRTHGMDTGPTLGHMEPEWALISPFPSAQSVSLTSCGKHWWNGKAQSEKNHRVVFTEQAALTHPGIQRSTGSRASSAGEATLDGGTEVCTREKQVQIYGRRRNLTSSGRGPRRSSEAVRSPSLGAFKELERHLAKGQLKNRMGPSLLGWHSVTWPQQPQETKSTPSMKLGFFL